MELCGIVEKLPHWSGGVFKAADSMEIEPEPIEGGDYFDNGFIPLMEKDPCELLVNMDVAICILQDEMKRSGLIMNFKDGED